MKSEYKLQRAQWRTDMLTENSPSLPAAAYWPESELGGDGPWNNYGDEDGECGNPPIVTSTANPDDVPSHDFF